ncbi:MFS general substrate transporter [Suillus subluteus]|nr:MFS general substrate transporter [Suillus subluteus]
MSEVRDEVNKLGSSKESVYPHAEPFDRPTGWRRYHYHPITQVLMLGFVCFMCPGIFTALTGLGGGGQVNSRVQANASAILYAIFAFFGLFSGSINNILGPRWTLMLGTLGYSLYIASFLVINIHPDAGAFVIAAGVILGICAALLWTAQGSLMMAYPTEAQKGMFISIFWTIFSLGGIMGSAVAFGTSFKNTVSDTYVGFLILTLVGVFLPLLMANPDKVIRTDGTRVNQIRHPSWKTELFRLYVTLKTDPWIILLFPMFFASNYCYTWEFNNYNGAIFTIRARGLNSLMSFASQVFGSVFLGCFILDQKRVRRRVRAFYGWILVFLMVLAAHAWAYFYQKTYTRAEATKNAYKIDITDETYAAHVCVMIVHGVLDSMLQTYAYWLMGAMSNDPAKLAVFTGFCAHHTDKSLQSAGAAGSWSADAAGILYMNIFLSTWCIMIAGMIFAAPMVYLRVTDHTDVEDETQ